MTVIGLVAGSIATPFYAKWLIGTAIDIPLFDVFKQIALIVFLPMIAGYLTQRFIIWKYGEAKYHKDIKHKFPMISTLGVLGIVFVAISLKAQTIIANPITLLNLLIPLVLLYTINFTLSTIIGKYFFKREDGIALVYGTVMRNLSIALAIAMTVFGEQGSDIALIIAIAYIIQVQSAAWYVKFNEKLFGTIPEDTVRDLMKEGIFALHKDSTIKEAIRLLDEEHIHSIAVLDDKEKVVGMLSAQSIVNLLAKNINLNKKLGEVELTKAVEIDWSTPIKRVFDKMKRSHKYKVLVKDEEGKLSGVLTESDIIDKYAHKK
jgi:CBS domain-containing protein